MKVTFVALAGLAALLTLCGSAVAAQVVLSTHLAEPDVNQVAGAPAVGRTLVVTATNYEPALNSTTHTVVLTPTANGPGVTFTPTSATVSVRGQGYADATFAVNIASTARAGVTTIQTYMNATNASSSVVERRTITTNIAVHRPAELVTSLVPAHRSGFGGGDALSFTLRARDPWNGWSPITISSVQVASCSEPASLWQPRVSTIREVVQSSSDVATHTIDFTAPPMNRDVDWERSVRCTLEITHNARNTSSPTRVDLRLNPYFAGTVSVADGGLVKLPYGADKDVAVSVQLKNRFGQPMTFTASPALHPLGFSVLPGLRSTTLQPGETGRLDLPLLVGRGVGEGTHEIALDLAGLDYGGVALESARLVARVTVVHPVEIALEAPAETAPVGPGQAAIIEIGARELHRWKTATIQHVSASCQDVDAGGWSVTGEMASATVGPGASVPVVGRIRYQAPPFLDPVLWRGRTLPCEAAVAYAAPNGQSFTATVPFVIDPVIPPALQVEFASVEPVIEFTRARSAGGEYPSEDGVEAIVRNWGELPYLGSVEVSSAGSCNVSWRSIEGAAVPAGPSPLPPPGVAVAGRLYAASVHPDGRCSSQPASLAASASPLAPSAPSGLPAYRVIHGAFVAAPERAEFGVVPVATHATISMTIREERGYQKVPLLVRIEADPTTRGLGHVDPTFDNGSATIRVTVDAGGSVQVPIHFSPPPGSPPCLVEWRVTWLPLERWRPGMELDRSTVVSAQVQLPGVASAESQLAALALDAERHAQVKKLLADFAARGCTLEDAEREAAVSTIIVLERLDDARRKLASGAAADAQAAATALRDVRGLLSPESGSPHRALAALDPAYRKIESQVAVRAAVVDEGSGGVDDLTAQLLALDELGADNATVLVARDDALAQLEVEATRSVDALTALFRARSRAPVGFELARDVSMNPNPFGWIVLGLVEDEIEENALFARTAFEEIPAVRSRVDAAEASAYASVAQARRALVLGAVFDAAIAVGFVLLVYRVLVRYTRDVREIGIGADLLADLAPIAPPAVAPPLEARRSKVGPLVLQRP